MRIRCHKFIVGSNESCERALRWRRRGCFCGISCVGCFTTVWPRCAEHSVQAWHLIARGSLYAARLFYSSAATDRSSVATISHITRTGRSAIQATCWSEGTIADCCFFISGAHALMDCCKLEVLLGANSRDSGSEGFQWRRSVVAGLGACGSVTERSWYTPDISVACGPMAKAIVM